MGDPVWEPRILLQRGAESREITLLEVGKRPGKYGYIIGEYSTSVDGQEFRLEFGGPPHEAYRAVNEFRPLGFRVHSCGTCVSFRFSGLTRDFSGGSSGYCRNEQAVADYLGRTPPFVSVFEWCPSHEFIEDRDRTTSYIRLDEDDSENNDEDAGENN